MRTNKRPPNLHTLAWIIWAATSIIVVLWMGTAHAETFGEWVGGMRSNELPIRAALYAAATVAGVLAHFLKTFLTTTSALTLSSYFLTNYPGRTVIMVLCQVGAACAYAFTGALDTMAWGAILSTGFTAGYAIDSATNKA